MSIVDKILLEAAPIKKLRYYYHATDSNGYMSISHEGIKGKYGVFLADSFQNAAKFLVMRGLKEIYVFKIDASHLDASKIEESFDHDEDFYKCKAWVYDGSISPDAILDEETKIFKM